MNFDEDSLESVFVSIFYGEDQNLIDSQISLDFATEIFDFFRK